MNTDVGSGTMKKSITGIHHITAMASDAQRNVDFYISVLGLRLVKRSINQDAPDVYHLYYGDEIGSPGTAMTFFPFGKTARGTRGNREISHVAFAVPTSSQYFWITHLLKQGISFDGHQDLFGETVFTFPDPDGMLIDLVFTEKHILRFPWHNSIVPAEHAIKAFHGVTMNLAAKDPSVAVLQGVLGARPIEHVKNRYRYVIGTGMDEAMIDLVIDPSLPVARQSAGSVHHIAWRVSDDAAHEVWQKTVAKNGLGSTDIIDRFYFHSIYFREPGGILYEIATDNPGFTVDETLDELGAKLVLPPWYEPHRKTIENALPPIHIPNSTVTS
ncbi:MAG: ring-cleaving dioxygenase [Bacteriovoracaceae bacterium]|nr:ring-cleaving dioxygenase [Bacteroidota bacterium]